MFRRGCQPPWNLLPSLINKVPPCQNITQMKQWFSRGTKTGDKGWDYYQWFTNSLSENHRKTGCPLPCTVAIFKYQNYSWPFFGHYIIFHFVGPNSPTTHWHGMPGWALMVTLTGWCTSHLTLFCFLMRVSFLFATGPAFWGKLVGTWDFFLGGSVLGFVDIIT